MTARKGKGWRGGRLEKGLNGLWSALHVRTDGKIREEKRGEIIGEKSRFEW